MNARRVRFLLGLTLGVVTALSMCAVSMYEAHAPILIEGNEQLTPANGVIRGSGTEEDPYVIEGWQVSHQTGVAIEIIGTSAHVLIKDCSILDSQDGIRISEASNVTVLNCDCSANDDAIVAFESTNIMILDCRITDDTGGGIGVAWSTDVTVRGNTVDGAAVGIEILEDSHRIFVTENKIRSTRWNGIYLRSVWNVLVEDNYLAGNRDHGIGIFGGSFDNELRDNTIIGSLVGIKTFENSRENLFIRNSISDCGIRGIELSEGSTGNLVTLNHIRNAGWALHVWDDANEIHGNTFEDNELGVRIEPSVADIALFHNNFLANDENVDCRDPHSLQLDNGSEGNYWMPSQADLFAPWDSDGNGISDSPARIGWVGVDRYPLMRPWQATVAIRGVRFSAPGEEAHIVNWTSAPISLEGWLLQSLDSEGTEVLAVYEFSANSVVGAGKTIVVKSGQTEQESSSEADTAVLIWASEKGDHWRDWGGMARLVDSQGNVVDEYSFDWSTGQ